MSPDRSAITIRPVHVDDGVSYEIAVFTLTVVPSRSRWQITVAREGVLLGMGVANLGDARARRELVRSLRDLDEDDEIALNRALVAIAQGVAGDWQEHVAWQQSVEREREAEQRRLREAEAADRRAARLEELDPVAHRLLSDPGLLHQIGRAMKGQGLVRETANSLLLYLALTSRLTSEPICVVVKGESSGGKSFLVKVVLRFFPDDAVIELTSMSERALLYDDRSYAHKTIVIFEAHGQGNEFANYVIRTLISEGELRHLTVEKTSEGLAGREIVKPGPTNFITTTTAPEGHAENETRLWSLLVDDSPGATRDVLVQQARGAAGIDATPPVDDWRAAQEWLDLAGVRDVVVPFAEPLARQLPARPLRLRRDFARLLLLIQTCAFLHQLQRERDQAGRIVATIGDYAMVRELVAEAFARGVSGLTEKTGELVEAVRSVFEQKVSAGARESEASISYADLVKATGRPKYYISRWLKPAVELGLIDNTTQGERGKAAALRPGHYRLDEDDVLPRAETLVEQTALRAEWVDPLTGAARELSTIPSRNTATLQHFASEPEEPFASVAPATATLADAARAPATGSESRDPHEVSQCCSIAAREDAQSAPRIPAGDTAGDREVIDL